MRCQGGAPGATQWRDDGTEAARSGHHGLCPAVLALRGGCIGHDAAQGPRTLLACAAPRLRACPGQRSAHSDRNEQEEKIHNGVLAAQGAR